MRVRLRGVDTGGVLCPIWLQPNLGLPQPPARRAQEAQTTLEFLASPPWMCADRAPEAG